MAKELLYTLTRKEFRVDTFRSGGKGGQNQNKRDTGVRITHLESGAVGESREERSQHQNKEKALKRLVASEKFKKWNWLKAQKVMGHVKTREEIEREVDEQIKRDLKNGLIIIEEIELKKEKLK
jgi:protein subunit release factor A